MDDVDPTLVQLRQRIAEREPYRLADEEAVRKIRAAVAEALRAGVPVGKLAEETGWHRNTIGAIRTEYGLPDARRHNRPPLRTRALAGDEGE